MNRSDKDKGRVLGHPDNPVDGSDATSRDRTIQYDKDKTQMNVGGKTPTNQDDKTQMNVGVNRQASGGNKSVSNKQPPNVDKTVIRNRPQNTDKTAVRNQPLNADRTAARNQPPNTDKTAVRNQPPNTDKTAVRNQPQKPADMIRARNTTSETDVTRVNSSGAHAPRPDATRISPRKPAPPSARQGQPPQRPPQPSRPVTAPNTVPPPASAASISPTSTNGNQPRILKGRFLLEKVLGIGGMGIVYKAKDRLKIEAHDRDPYVAIKVLSEEFRAHPESFIALQRESRKSQRMAHPNTVKVYDFDRDGDIVFMTMEYLEGMPLDQMLRQYSSTGLPVDDAWTIIEGMCSALAHAHMENIVHSDFKPGNVYVTTSGIAKVFDFGIARAVANVDRNDGKAIDKTVFDAGSLGALTPAYASLEMLQGKTPDIRDDIYALGCVIYELFTGSHPFGKLPADEAYKKGLKVKRIDGITKRQWRAIEKSLAFKRSDRIETVEELHKELTVKYKPSYVVAAAMVVIIGLSSVIYIQSTNTRQNVDVNAIEFKVRFDVYKKTIAKLINEPSFSLDWEENLWSEVKGVSEFLPSADDEWLVATKEKIYQLYVDKIHEKMKAEELKRAKFLIDNAYRYAADKKFLNNEKIKLAEAIKRMEKNKEKRLAQQIEVQKENQSKYNEFNVALDNVNSQLRCQGRLNMRDFAIAIRKLKSIDNVKYNKMELKLVNSLSSCISQIGKAFPERAQEAKKSAMRVFNSHPKIAAIKISARDACDISIAGLGASGSRSVCRDKIRGIGQGPTMVVVPGAGNIKPFAIGKFEVSVDEMNLFCKSSKKCKVNNSVDKSLPSTKISIRTAKSYLKWLSDKTGQKYRLPSDDEWMHAANSRRKSLDSNRNCQLSSRGIQKGGELVKTSTGRQNSWGLVNYVGNAQEWVYGNGRKLIVVGGSYKDSMDVCNTTLRRAHSGSPDERTGFRIIRELRDKRS